MRWPWSRKPQAETPKPKPLTPEQQLIQRLIEDADEDMATWDVAKCDTGYTTTSYQASGGHSSLTLHTDLRNITVVRSHYDRTPRVLARNVPETLDKAIRGQRKRRAMAAEAKALNDVLRHLDGLVSSDE